VIITREILFAIRLWFKVDHCFPSLINGHRLSLMELVLDIRKLVCQEEYI